MKFNDVQLTTAANPKRWKCDCGQRNGKLMETCYDCGGDRKPWMDEGHYNRPPSPPTATDLRRLPEDQRVVIGDDPLVKAAGRLYSVLWTHNHPASEEANALWVRLATELATSKGWL